MESIFLILSGVILAAGVLYWFWSHIQLTQKKVQLLESAVFELRGVLVPATAPAKPTEQVDNDWEPETETEIEAAAPVPQQSTSLEELASTEVAEASEPEELQPGGGAKVGDEFRELFIQHDPPSATTPSPAREISSQESLETMPVRELRRLAEQRGLTGVSELRKKELLTALRQQITMTPAEAKGNSVVVEHEDTPEKSDA
jgi:hypothetical protein